MKKKTIHILYVEDDLNLSYVIKDNLTLAGYLVCHCENGKEALEKIEAERFDLCILDIMLPKIDGFEIAKKIRENDQQVPIIFLSAKSLSIDKIKGLKLGADDYITKPFSIEELLLKIKVFLKRSQLQPTEVFEKKTYQLGNYTFDKSNLLLSHSGDEVQLTMKEGNLLQLFCENVNEVIRRDFILNQIWGDDDYFLGRSLDVFISRLRKYLKHDSSVKIENIHGVGFRIKCK